MDILLTHGYFLGEDEQEQSVMRPYPPLGLLYLSSYLKSRGVQVEVLDTTFSTRREWTEFVQRHRPPVIGFYCNLLTRGSVLDLIRRCRELDCLVVVGGPEPANYPEEYLDRGADLVVMGEGEQTLEELLSSAGPECWAEIPGIVFREAGGSLVRTPARPHIRDLDSLPFPDREAIDISSYIRRWKQSHGMGAVSLITSRGCPYTCSWCSHSVFGYSHRARSPINVADEVEQIMQQYRPDMLWYCDDVFTINPRWVFQFAEEMKRRSLKIPFETISREDRLDEEIITTLAEMGCARLWLGSESGAQSVMDAMQRRTDVRRLPEVVKMLQQHGIQAGLFVMLGYEGEGLEELERTMEHLKACSPDLFLSTLAYPIKGTPYFDEVADRVRASGPWEGGSDRDLRVKGRRTSRFYAYANRWLVSEVDYYKKSHSPERDLLGTTRSYLSARLGRLGMLLTQYARER